MSFESPLEQQYAFRFSGGGYACPYCHSRTGWSYIRNYGKEYGMCFACGAKNYPSDTEQKPTQPISSTIRYVPLGIVEKTLAAYGHNPFVTFLERTFGAEVTHRVIAHFKVGTARNEGTVFWHIDVNGFFRKPKVVYYNIAGKRIKDDLDRQPNFAGYTNEQGYTLPLYGEHQLNEHLYPVHTPVILVESEKTACVGYAVLPQYIWLATGGSTAMNYHRAKVLRSRQVILLPDADQPGREGAVKFQAILQQAGAQAVMKDLFPNQADHTDIADHIIYLYEQKNLHQFERQLPLAHPMPQEKVKKAQQLFDKNPALWELVEKFELIIEDVKPVNREL